jgi:hypothetical protein
VSYYLGLLDSARGDKIGEIESGVYGVKSITNGDKRIGDYYISDDEINDEI